jgi:hypothetical protein
MDYGALLIRSPLENDIKFKNVVMSIMDFASAQLVNYHGKFTTEKQYWSNRRDIEYQFEHPGARDKFGVISSLESMIIYLPPPKVKKVVREYYDAQMTAYCHSMRGFSKEIPNYPYKSDNIVDLLEEVETVYNEKREKFNELFSPKPFCFSCYYNDDYANSVYMPRRDVWIDDKGDRCCLCVHMCKKFLTYPVVKGGIRLIPDGAKCDYDKIGHRCSGSLVVKNGMYSEETQSIEHTPYLMSLKNKQR